MKKKNLFVKNLAIISGGRKVKKVLIVDDEKIIREGLKYLIDWENYGFSVVAMASNGKEGLQAIETYHPDLVITDIKMPEQTGLEMVQTAKERLDYPFYSIILSGYSEFEYAQQSVSLGFTSYLLKPVDEDELIAVLKTIQEETAKLDENDFEKRLFDKIFGTDKTGLTDYQFINCSRFDQAIPVDILEQLEELPLKYVVLNNLSKYYLILLTTAPLNQDVYQFTKICANRGKIISTGWVSAKQDLTVIPKQLNDLSEAAFMFPNQLILPEKITRMSPEIMIPVTLDDLVSKIIATNDLTTVVMAYGRSLCADYYLKDDLIWKMRHDYATILDKIKEKLQKSIAVDESAFCEKARQADSYPELITLFKEELEKLSRQIAEEFNNIDIIDQLIYYVDRHYEEDLTLKDIADHFGYNSAYLGKKFKRKMDESFLNYLEKVRMEKATDLLKESHLMVYEIADKVGYNNIDYFYKKFKHFYHISPNEYRRQIAQKSK